MNAIKDATTSPLPFPSPPFLVSFPSPSFPNPFPSTFPRLLLYLPFLLPLIKPLSLSSSLPFINSTSSLLLFPFLPNPFPPFPSLFPRPISSFSPSSFLPQTLYSLHPSFPYFLSAFSLLFPFSIPFPFPPPSPGQTHPQVG